MALDNPTLLMVAACLFVLLPLNIWLVLPEPRPDTFRLWCCAAFTGGLGMLMLSLRGGVADVLSYGGYSLLVLAMLLFMQALRMDLQRPLPRWALITLPLLHLLIVQILLTMNGTALQLAVIVRSFNLMGMLAVAITAAQLVQRERSVMGMLIGLGFFIPALAIASNLVASWQGHSMLDDLRSGVPNLLIGLTGMLCSLLANIGYLGLQLERRHRSLVALQASHSRQERRHALRRELARLERTRTVGLLGDSLAHALLQPLAALRVQAEIGARAFSLTRVQDSALLYKVLASARMQLERVDEKVEQIRRFLQPTPAMPEADVDLCQLLREVEPLVRQEAINHGVRLDLEIPTLPVQLPADRLSVMQVLLQVMRHGLLAAGGVEGGHVRLRVVQGQPDVRVEVLHDGASLVPSLLHGTLLPASGLETAELEQEHSVGLMIAWRLMQEAGGSLQHDKGPDGSGGCILVRWSLAPSGLQGCG